MGHLDETGSVISGSRVVVRCRSCLLRGQRCVEFEGRARTREVRLGKAVELHWRLRRSVDRLVREEGL